MDAIATVTTLSKNSKLAGVYGITIDEKDNLYVITTAYDGAGVPNNPLIDPAIYKIDSKTRDNIIFVVSLANDTRGQTRGFAISINHYMYPEWVKSQRLIYGMGKLQSLYLKW